MRLISRGSVVLVAVALAACASPSGSLPAASTSPATASRPAPTTGPSAPSKEQNKAAAQAEAERLVSMVELPPGAHPETAQPAGLSGPAMGTPGISQLIDRVAYYRVAMTLAEAQSWFAAHPPPGFSPSGTSSGADSSGPTSYGFGYDPTGLRPSWGSASLEVGLARAGSAATGVRVDGVAQWIDPSPVRDPARGRAMRVTVSAGCPTSDRGYFDVSNPDARDLDHQLLPAGAPTAALRCSYDGMNGKPFALTDSQHLDAAKASAAADAIRALPLGSRGLGAHSCPMADGRADILVFSFAGRADVDIWQDTSGCRSTKNGHILSGDV